MKLKDLSSIDDPLARFVQASRFLRNLNSMIEVTAEIRDRSLLEARERVSQNQLASMIGVSQQQISRLETRAKELYSIKAPWES